MACILCVDDEATNLKVLRTVLQDDYRLLFAKHGTEAIKLAVEQQPDLILLDVMMPEVTGFEVCDQLKQNPETSRIPIIFVTALQEEQDEAYGLQLGAVDYITKPISPSIVRARVKTHLSLVHTDELKATRLQVVQRLGRAAEYKDNETGLHVLRMSHFARLIALQLGCDPAWCEDLLHAAPMHDIGKIGIPDHILLKPGKLTAEEYAVMQRHPLIGAEIIGECDSRLLQLAREVALYHHEKWDGSGYPHGLVGDAIPLSARIVAIADVFDALSSPRPYKAAWPLPDVLAYLEQQRGQHFEPAIVDALLAQLEPIQAIQQLWAEQSN